MDASANDISIIVEAQSYGKLFNTEYNTIKELTDKIYGINVVYNDDAISNGQDVETEEEWRIRFSKTVQGLSRGTVSSVESGALTAKVLDNNGFITEFVQKVLVQETSASSLRITIHNGKNYETSQALVSECKKIVDGYTDTDGVYQPGYKPAGVTVSVYPAFFQSQNLYITVSSESNIASQYVKSSIVDSIQKYFLSLDISDGFAPASAMAYANTTGSTEYSYRIVCVDTSGNKSLPSDVVLVPNGNATPNNTVRWSYTALDGAPTVGSYDILRWDPTYETWRLVANVGGSVSEYVDINTDLSEYAFFPPRKKVFQRSELTKILMSISGVSSIRLYLDAKSKYISLSSRRGTGLTVDTTILGGSGVISAISVHSGSAGTNYAIGDVIQISGGITPAYAMISSVNVNTGAVVSIVVMDGGTGYASSATDVPVSWPIPTEPSVVVPPAGYVLTPGIVSIQ
jgi:hypothetical protein